MPGMRLANLKTYKFSDGRHCQEMARTGSDAPDLAFHADRIHLCFRAWQSASRTQAGITPRASRYYERGNDRLKTGSDAL